jgi:hypothetical protein
MAADASMTPPNIRSSAERENRGSGMAGVHASGSAGPALEASAQGRADGSAIAEDRRTRHPDPLSNNEIHDGKKDCNKLNANQMRP